MKLFRDQMLDYSITASCPETEFMNFISHILFIYFFKEDIVLSFFSNIESEESSPCIFLIIKWLHLYTLKKATDSRVLQKATFRNITQTQTCGCLLEDAVYVMLNGSKGDI